MAHFGLEVCICLQLVSWDTRQHKVLVEYAEHVNDCSRALTVGVDRNNHFVYAGSFGGSDAAVILTLLFQQQLFI